MLRTSCTRTAFQNSDSSALRVSIDTGLTFTKARLSTLALQVFAVAMTPNSLLVLCRHMRRVTAGNPASSDQARGRCSWGEAEARMWLEYQPLCPTVFSK